MLSTFSTDQIHVAKSKFSEIDQLTFSQQDAVLMSDEDEFDVVISLFGLHWIENLDAIAENIYKALKPNGIHMHFVPLEKTKFFALRKQLVSNDKWQEFFSHYELKPFVSDPDQYFTAFKRWFVPENLDGPVCGSQTVDFDPNRFSQFLSSWMQELRHLANTDLVNAFISELISMLPVENGLCHDVETDPQTGDIKFHERFAWFHGRSRKPTEIDPQTERVLKKNVSF